MRLGWALKQNWFPHKKREIWTETHTQRKHNVMTEAKIRVMFLLAKEYQGLPATSRNSGKAPSLQPIKRMVQPTPRSKTSEL